MSSSIRDRVVKLLGQNIQQSVVAAAVGVSDSYVSQLLAEEGVSEEIAKLRAEKLEEAVQQAETIDTVKKLALAKIKGQLPFAKSPLEAARVFQILDNAKRVDANPTADTAGVQTVQIVLPASVRGSVRIQINEQNQVIDVEGRSMAPLPSKALPALAAARKQQATTMELPQPAKSDTAVAAEKLEKLADITTIMNGVPLVL